MSTSAERMRRLRARRAELLEPVPDAVPRDPDELLLPDVERSLEALHLGAGDAGMAQIARRLAAAIDNAKDPAAALRVFCPLLHRAMESLGGTPAARARSGAVKVPQRQAPNAVAQLRAAHQAAKAKQRRGAAV